MQNFAVHGKIYVLGSQNRIQLPKSCSSLIARSTAIFTLHSKIFMPRRKMPVKLTIVLMSAATFTTLTQIEVPLFLKPMVLLLPLQMAALGYVAWYWRDRSKVSPGDS